MAFITDYVNLHAGVRDSTQCHQYPTANAYKATRVPPTRVTVCHFEIILD